MALTTVKSDQIQTSVALAGSPTTTTQSASDNSTKVATTAYVETAVANLVASAPTALNTLDELAAALNDDASFSTTVTNSIAAKAPLASPTFTGNIVATSSIKLNGQTSSDGLRLDLAGSTDYKIGETSTNDIVSFGAAGGAATHLIHHNISSGHVGIGTASPAALLDVGGGNVADPTIRIDSASGGDPTLIFDASQANRSARIKFYDNGSNVGGFIDYLHNGDKMNFGAGSAANATMTVGDGAVGIGTDSPGRLLTLFNNDQPVFQITNNTSGTASTRGLIMYQATGSTTSIIDNQGSGSGGAIQFYRAGSLSLGISATGTIYTETNGIIESASSAGSLTISGGSTNKGGQILLRGGNGDSDIVFKAQASTATPTERVRINSTGLIIKDSSFIFDKPSVYGFRFLHNDAGNDLSIQIGDANNANYRSLANFDSNGLNINFTNNNTNMSRLRLGRNCLDDCYVFFNSGAGAGDWSLGTDYSDSSKFKLSRTSTPGNGNNIFEIGTGGDMAFNVHLTPYTTNTYDLGTSTVRWRNIYSQDLHLSNEDTGGNDVDGTEGNWTIQEGEEDLYIINNKTGKKFRFALEEIT